MISTCPKCQKQVSLPTGGDSTVWVRCPWCASEYVLDEALNWTPPELILLASPPATDEPAARTPMESDGAETGGDEAAAAAYPVVSDPTLTLLRRRRSKSTSRTFLEIVLGGIAGVIVAYYLLAFYYGPRFPEVMPQFPLPFISWITAPPKDEIQLEPAPEHQDRGWEQPPPEK